MFSIKVVPEFPVTGYRLPRRTPRNAFVSSISCGTGLIRVTGDLREGRPSTATTEENISAVRLMIEE
ncbi:hypothetical protein EVAR_23734_1 [Eumeta japonica]|uniref:Uncharacterized protein n=1 Tax=Eumeta variegata TaxID=151549 RepID=A0A4C1VJ09_EUMVA|nr:hypothetical protein EVAR_23734_1 [Eumeta japonica]